MEIRNYETVFILTPVLSDEQIKETVDKFREVVANHSDDSEIYHEENWGIKKLAYEIDHKSTGYYALFEYKANPTIVNYLETEFRRDERVLRFLTVTLDKHALDYSERRRRGEFNKKKSEKSKEEKAA